MRIVTTILLLTISLGANALQVSPQNERSIGIDPSEPSMSVMQGDGLTLGEAIERVKRQYNGRIVDAKTRCNGNRQTHVIKVLTQDGRVKTVTVPGKRCG